MRTLQLLSFLLPAAALSSFSLPPAAAGASEGVEVASRAAQGVNSLTELLQFFGRPQTTVQEGVEASATFVKGLLNGIIEDKEALEKVEKAITQSVNQYNYRTSVLMQMNELAERIKEGDVLPEGEEVLREQLKLLAKEFKDRNYEMFTEGLTALGMQKEEAEQLVGREGFLTQFANFLEDAALVHLRKYL